MPYARAAMVIDIHIHPYCREATVTPNPDEAFQRMYGQMRERSRLKALKAQYDNLFKQKCLEDVINDMDEAGIDKACIVAMDLTTKYNVINVTNDDVSKFSKMYPDRFIPFASVDPSMGRAAVDKLVYAVEKLGCRGVKLVPPVQGFDFSDPKHDPLWEAALDMGIVVWTHVAHQMGHPGSDARLGHPMLVEPVANRYPDLKLVLGHCGFPWVWETWSVVIRHPNVYVDISAYIRLYDQFPWDLYHKGEDYGAHEKILFATDYPFLSFKETRDAFDRVDLPIEFKNKILGENAKRLLQI